MESEFYLKFGKQTVSTLYNKALKVNRKITFEQRKSK